MGATTHDIADEALYNEDYFNTLTKEALRLLLRRRQCTKPQCEIIKARLKDLKEATTKTISGRGRLAASQQ